MGSWATGGGLSMLSSWAITFLINAFGFNMYAEA
jgi:hypothetical protein